VTISWDDEERLLTIRDDGTGMSQQIIERNLLKAGASRYQEEGFRREHPDFTPISRFGIGVLSAFMIADFVEITTCSLDDMQGRQLTLRSVHGRYLVELLDKDSDDRAQSLLPHGTEVRLRVRASARMPDVVDTLRRWTVIPECTVTAVGIDSEPIPIGYKTPADALAAFVEGQGYEVTLEEHVPDKVRIIAHENDGLQIAYAVRWSPFFKEAEFVVMPDESGADSPRLGTCIAGIRVEDGTPGFTGLGIMAIANAVGPNAPKTNVARSGMEVTPQRDDLLRRIYRFFLLHVASEARALHEQRGMSLTWSAQEVDVLLRPLRASNPRRAAFQGGETVFLSHGAFEDELARHPLLLIEEDGERRLERGDALEDADIVWTVDSAFVRAAERLLREVPTQASLTSLATGFNMAAFDLPNEPTMVGYAGGRAGIPETVLRQRDVGKNGNPSW